MKCMDYFDRVYVINLPERRDRYMLMKRSLQRAGFPSETESIHIYPGIRPGSPGPFSSIGVRGCYMSHLSVLKNARDSRCRRIVVMEDDLDISPAFTSVEEELTRQLDITPWDFAYLGHHLDLPHHSGPITLRPYAGEIRLAHFYAVKGEILDSLISFLETLLTRPKGHPDGGPMHVDGAFSTYRAQNPHIKTLVCVPSLGNQRSSRSDITSKNWFDRTPVIRTVADNARFFAQLIKLPGIR